MIANRFGSSPYSSALPRSQRTAAFASCTWAGNSACALERTLMPATAYPAPVKNAA